MNIFVVDRDPVIAATMLCDQHVVKMITESAQMLSTCHRVLDGVMTKQQSVSGKRMVPTYKLDDGRDNVLYRAVHFNHPCNIWLRDSIQHYDWLVQHTYGLCREYTKRYNKVHACQQMLEYLCMQPQNIPTYDSYPKNITFVQAMPDEYKNSDPVVAYRNFYRGSKSKFARWKYTNPPRWYLDATPKSVRSVSTLRGNQKPLSDDLRLL